MTQFPLSDEDRARNRAALQTLTDAPAPPDLARRALARWSPSSTPPLARPLRWSLAALAVVGLAALAVWPRPYRPLPISIVQRTERTHPRPLPTREGSKGSRPLLKAGGSRKWVKAFPMPLPLRKQPGIPAPLPYREGPGVGSSLREEPAAIDDLAYVNAGGPDWRTMPTDDAAAWEAKIAREVRRGDEFVAIPFPRVAGRDDRATAAALTAYQREAAIVDSRLFQKISVGEKGIAFRDLCRQWSERTNIQFAAGPSVADDKITIFCTDRPVRDIMRQIVRVFGFSWRRTDRAPDDKPAEWEYELVQDLHGQIQEEELRNRDRNAALLALDREMQRYRKYLNLTPAEARAQAETATNEDEKSLLKNLSEGGWGTAHLYFGLGPDDMTALRNGGSLQYSASPTPGTQTLPPDIAQGVLSAYSFYRVSANGLGPVGSIPGGVPPGDFPGIAATARLHISGSELGEMTLTGGSGFATGSASMSGGASLATGVSPSVAAPDNAKANAALARDPALRRRVSIIPKPSGKLEIWPYSKGSAGEKATTADVLEAVHKATGMDIVGDSFLRVYPPAEVTKRNAVLFDALNQLGDTMRDRWRKDDGWLQFRSRSFFNDRRKEVPNRLLTKWAKSRAQNKVLTLDDLTEIASLSDAQLDSGKVSETVRSVFGLAEWEMAANPNLRRHWRFLASLPASTRQSAWRAPGLALADLPLSAQQQMAALTFGGDATPAWEQVAGATLAVRYLWADPKQQAAQKAWAGGEPPKPVAFVYTHLDPQHGRMQTEIGPHSSGTRPAPNGP